MEDGDISIEEVDEFDEEEEASPSKPSPQQEKLKPCNLRIDELSTPFRRKFLALWNEHAYHLPKDKVDHLKQLLQELYAMTPEETTKYFEELKAEARKRMMRRKLKQKLRKYLMNKHKQKQRQKAYRLFKRLLKCGIKYAVENPIPPLVSLRLRYLSDVVLEQLAELRCLNTVPNRANPDKTGAFLISVADWMAIAIERLYYAAQCAMEEGYLETLPDEPTFKKDEDSKRALSQIGSMKRTNKNRKCSRDDQSSFQQPSSTSPIQSTKNRKNSRNISSSQRFQPKFYSTKIN